jgi:succinyl-diaminopimelate desuccinylase
MNILEELIKIESCDAPRADEAILLAQAYLKEQGIEGTIINNQGYTSYVAVVGSGPRTLVLNGHLDVVPGTPFQFGPKGECWHGEHEYAELESLDVLKRILVDFAYGF